MNEQLNAPWEEISFLPDRIIDLGDRILALCHFEMARRCPYRLTQTRRKRWTPLA